ncbi:DUF397 domain-containing protein [Streptomyces sp. NPDC002156]
MSTHHNGTWFKSSYSDETGGTCVEVAHPTPAHPRIGVRDSKHPQGGPTLLLPPKAFAALLTHLRS